ncbi:hypothetical protein DSOL_4812 [Desulfosporosinus metallidurans]|uniref:Uncharacterized protein n=1 Tax=Desulfosporosinus metallidurans TaxID=1888891 RepID=A0A1Q8QHN0_9FIRM|nr:hypothetical protein DSOL_4812 [Desulfosporosinus metallidurans]
MGMWKSKTPKAVCATETEAFRIKRKLFGARYPDLELKVI